MAVRQPIVAVLGHVDSGKTSLLDKVRGTGVQGREAGGITQHIGASFLPADTIRKTCGRLYDRLKSETRIPGILVIDTPGHEVFKNLRTRGGSAADIAILVIDAARGFQPQTNESLKILQSRKVPFVVALNKCDQISGWRDQGTPFISESAPKQDALVRTELDNKIYDVVGTLSVLGYRSEAFYRVKDFKAEVSIIPISARTGVGIPELLTVLVALTQQYMTEKLDQARKEPRGIVLEAKHEPGLGETANIILIDGRIRKGDRVVMAKRDGVIVTKPKAILLPRALDEMRDPRDKFVAVDSVEAAAGLKVASPDIEGVLPGSTLYVADSEDDVKRYSDAIRAEMESVFIDTQTRGVHPKVRHHRVPGGGGADAGDAGVQISKADIGPVNRRDVMEARAIKEGDRRLGVVLAFNVRVLPDAAEEAEAGRIRIFQDRVIYRLIDDYTGGVRDDIIHEEDAVFSEITPLAKFTFLKGYVFRNNNPAVFGIPRGLRGAARQGPVHERGRAPRGHGAPDAARGQDHTGGVRRPGGGLLRPGGHRRQAGIRGGHLPHAAHLQGGQEPQGQVLRQAERRPAGGARPYNRGPEEEGSRVRLLTGMLLAGHVEARRPDRPHHPLDGPSLQEHYEGGDGLHAVPGGDYPVPVHVPSGQTAPPGTSLRCSQRRDASSCRGRTTRPKSPPARGGWRRAVRRSSRRSPPERGAAASSSRASSSGGSCRPRDPAWSG